MCSAFYPAHTTLVAYPPSAWHVRPARHSIVPQHRSSAHPLTPLLRLFDDLTSDALAPLDDARHTQASFTPRFDIRELPDAFELHGEVPGFEKENLRVEWHDENTLSVSGEYVRESTTGSGDKTPIDAADPVATSAIADAEPAADNTSTAASASPAPADSQAAVAKDTSHHASVSDEADDGRDSVSVSSAANHPTVQLTPTTTTAQDVVTNEDVAKTSTQTPEGHDHVHDQARARPRYWVTERQTGRFTRSFVFPARAVAHEGVTARVNNGVLEVRVPKVERKVKRGRIEIS